MDIPGLSRMVWVSSMYGDTLTEKLMTGTPPCIIQLSLVYEDTQTHAGGCPWVVQVSSLSRDTTQGSVNRWTSLDCPG